MAEEKKTTAQKVEAGLKGARSKEIAQDIIAGTKFGESVVGEGDLGRLGQSADIQKGLDVLRQGAEGFSSAEATARRERALENIGQQTRGSSRALQAALARAGVKGGAAGAQLRDVELGGLQQRANVERDLFLAGEDARRSGARDLIQASSNIGKFDLGQAAREKNIALQSGLGFAQLGTAERAAFLSSQAASKAAAARSSAVGGGGAGGALSGGLIGGLIGGGGGAIAGAVGGIFCHEENTMVRMSDGSLKKIKDLRLGDETLLGGKVTLKGDMLNEEEIYEYAGEFVTGSHFIVEDNIWLRVDQSKNGKRREDMDNCVTCPIETENSIYVTEAGYISGDLKFELEVLSSGGLDEINTSKEIQPRIRLSSSL